MKLFDLHCDTLYKATTQNKELKHNDLYIDLDRGKVYKKWAQCFAVWIPDDLNTNDSRQLFKKCYNKFLCEIKPMQDKEFNPILTVENLKLIGKDINYLDYLSNCGVKIATLTWNDKNSIGGGSSTKEGISSFGKDVVKKMERLNMIIDISHASEKLFWDVYENSSKPIIATHSNSKEICNNIRNLTDKQIKSIIDRNGLIGINLHKPFISTKKNPSFKDLLKHIDKMLSLGAEDCLSLGTDFDGADIIDEIKGIEDTDLLINYLLQHNYSERIVEKIFFDNTHAFFDTNKILF